MRLKFTIPILILVFLLSFCLAEDGKYGKPGDYLRFGTCAQGLAMGGAFSTLAHNGDALLYNPAGLAQLERWELSLTYAQLFMDSRYNHFSFAYPVQNIGNFGLSLANIGVSNFDGRDIYNRPTGDFSSNNSAISAGYGRWVWERKVRVGIAVKYLMSSMEDYSANGFGGLDIGIVTRDFVRRLRFGASVHNIGASTISGDEYPISFRLGAMFKAMRRIFILADLEIVDDIITPHIGAEAQISKFLKLRAGYNMSELSFGMGLALDRLISSLAGVGRPSLDYAAAAMNPLGEDFVRLTLTFNGPERYDIRDLMAQTNPCDHLVEFEGLLDKDGLIGAKANLIYGDCYFTYESEEAPLDVEPAFKDIHYYFKEAYIGKFGTEWPQAIMATEDANLVFSQRTHYMFAEVCMFKELNEDTKNLIKELIFLGGDSTQYDVRLQYDLGYTFEALGYIDSAKNIYSDIAEQDELEDPVRALSLYRLAKLIQKADSDSSIYLLEKLVKNFGYGFYDELWGRLTYPMIPKKYVDNSVADNALLLMGDIYAEKGGDDNLKSALISYLDILLFYPNAESEVVKKAVQRAANVYENLGEMKQADAMKRLLGTL